MAPRTPFAPGSLAQRSVEPVSRAGRAGNPRGRSGQGFWGITAGDARQLRVMIANQPQDRPASWAETLSDLGHTLIPWDVDAEGVGASARRAEPDVALVGLGPDRPHALGLIAEIAQTAVCPVIAMLAEPAPCYVREAARRGVFAYSLGATPEALQGAIDISLQRFSDYRSLQDAFQRRATIEQAKGILMERHGLDADSAFALLRNHSQNSGRRLVDIATVIVASNLLPPQPATRTPTGPQPLAAGAELPSVPYAGTRT